MSRRRTAIRAAESVLIALVALVLPTTISTPGAYIAAVVPCLVAAVVLGYLDGRTGR